MLISKLPEEKGCMGGMGDAVQVCNVTLHTFTPQSLHPPPEVRKVTLNPVPPPPTPLIQPFSSEKFRNQQRHINY